MFGDLLKTRENLSANQRKALRTSASAVIDVVPIPWDLEILAWKYGTDKVLHGYMQHYKKHFSPFRHKKINLLEIGIGTYGPRGGGASLRTWRHYFSKGNINGLDIVDKVEHQEKRIKTYKGDQSDEEFLLQTARDIGPLQIIIDDGSHINSHVAASFRTLFPILEVGGVYVIEDIQTSYLSAMGGSSTDLNKSGTSMNLAKDLCDNVNSMFIPNKEISYLDRHVESVHFYRNIIFIHKGDNSSYKVHEYALHMMDKETQGKKQQYS